MSRRDSNLGNYLMTVPSNVYLGRQNFGCYRLTCPRVEQYGTKVDNIQYHPLISSGVQVSVMAMTIRLESMCDFNKPTIKRCQKKYRFVQYYRSILLHVLDVGRAILVIADGVVQVDQLTADQEQSRTPSEMISWGAYTKKPTLIANELTVHAVYIALHIPSGIIIDHSSELQHVYSDFRKQFTRQTLTLCFSVRTRDKPRPDTVSP